MRQIFLDFLDKAAVELFGMTSDRGTLEESLAGTSVVESAMVLDSAVAQWRSRQCAPRQHWSLAG